MLHTTVVYLELDDDHGVALDEERLLLHRLLCLGVDLLQEFNDLAFLHKGVEVQHGLVPRGEDGLVVQQLKDLELRLELQNGRNRLLCSYTHTVST